MTDKKKAGVAVLSGSQGHVYFDIETGLVLEILSPDTYATIPDYGGSVIVRVDVEEWKRAYPDDLDNLDADHDILDFGYWVLENGEIVYEGPETEWREDTARWKEAERDYDNRRYKLSLTSDQAHTVVQACNLLARLGVGQMDDALRALPLNIPDIDWDQYCRDKEQIIRLARKHTVLNSHSCDSYLSIGSDKIREEAKIAWDIKKTIEHCIAWAEALSAGLTNSRQHRDMRTMSGKQYDALVHPVSSNGYPEVIVDTERTM